MLQPTLKENDMFEITPDQIIQQYVSTMDSVNLINNLKSKESLTTDEIDTLARNVEHVKIMLQKDFWTNEDLIPFRNAV